MNAGTTDRTIDASKARRLIAGRFFSRIVGVGALSMLWALSPVASAADAPEKSRRGDPPTLEGAAVEVYKKTDQAELNLYIFTPPGHAASDRRPAIVFFFGGGWRSGSPKQFQEHCRYLASRGIVAMTADYRVSSRHQTKAIDCVRDGKSAVRWIRKNAGRLGVDPDRIAAGGGSAGGHVAACTGLVEGLEQAGEDTTVSSQPNALALFNPAVILALVDGGPALDPQRMKDMPERVGGDPESISPYHHVDAQEPPTIIFHGKDDTAVPYWTVEKFCEAMKEAGNRCRLVGYEGQGHGFFNYGRGDGNAYRDTIRELDGFLVSLGYLNQRGGGQ